MKLHERMIAEKVIDSLLATGHNVSVNDDPQREGEWVVKQSTDKAFIMAALASTEGDTLRIRSDGPGGGFVGDVHFVYGNEPGVLISDHSDNATMRTLLQGAEVLATAISNGEHDDKPLNDEVDPATGTVKPRRGLRISVYRDAHLTMDCTNGGISSKFTQVTVIGDEVAEVDEPREDAPAVCFAAKEVLGQRYIHLLPCDSRGAALPGHWMMGGNFAFTSDSRFGEAATRWRNIRDDRGRLIVMRQPVAIHDRKE